MITFKAFGQHFPHDSNRRTVGGLVSLIAICSAALLSGCHSSRPVDDAAITQGVKTKLSAVFGPIEAKQVSQFDRGADQQTVSYISVSSLNGFVTLNGEVSSKKAKQRAGEIAHGVDHVVSVNNNLAVAPGYSDDAVGHKP